MRKVALALEPKSVHKRKSQRDHQAPLVGDAREPQDCEHGGEDCYKGRASYHLLRTHSGNPRAT